MEILRKGPVVTFDRVTAGYRTRGRRRIVLDELSLTIRPHTVGALIGPNGAGKSTLVRVLLGHLTPWAGNVWVDGWRPRCYRRRRGVAFVPERTTLPPGWTIGGFLRLGARLAGLPSGDCRRAVAEMLDVFGLSDGAAARLGALSKGQARRVVLAFALLGEPGLVVLDEPWSNLDPDGRASLARCLRRMCSTGATVLVSSHELSEVARVSDVVHVISGGAVARRLVGDEIGTEVLERVALPGGTEL